MLLAGAPASTAMVAMAAAAADLTEQATAASGSAAGEAIENRLNHQRELLKQREAMNKAFIALGRTARTWTACKALTHSACAFAMLAAPVLAWEPQPRQPILTALP